MCGRLRVFRIVALFQEEVRTGGEERMRRLLRCHHRDHMPVLRIQASKEIEDLTGLTDRLTDVPESIRQVLEPRRVRRDVHVSLHQVPELR